MQPPDAGNPDGSGQMIFEHYRACLAVVGRRQELVTEKAAKAWFAITPNAAEALKAKVDKEREEKIVKFPATASSSGRGYIRPGSRWERRNVSTEATE